MKKIISVLLVAVLLFSVAPSNLAIAEDKTDSVAVDMLKELGIIDSSYQPSDTMTRLEFIRIVSRIFKEDTTDYTGYKYFEDVTASTPYANDINKMAAYGIIKGGQDALFGGGKPVTMDQVTAMLVRLLGYEYAAVNSGGYPNGFTVIASNIGLYKNMPDGALQSDKYLTMLYNALDIDVMDQVGWGENTDFEVTKDKTILSNVLKVFEHKGVLNAVGKVALANKYMTVDNAVIIGDVRFNIDPGDTAYMLDGLGSNVTGYYKETDDDIYELLFYKKNSSSELTLNLEDIVSVSADEIKYQTADDRTTQAKISPAIYIVYNNRPAVSLPVLGKNGTIKLVGSGDEYNTMIIKNYSTFVVDYASANYYTISSKYTNEVLPKFEDESKYQITAKDGTPVEFSSLAEWDVLSVARSENDEFIEMVVSKDSFTGTVEEIQEGSVDDFALVISGQSYHLTQEYYNYIATSLGYAVDIEDQGLFYLDKNGKIAGFDKQVSEGIKLGYLVMIAAPRNDMDDPKIKIFTSNGKMEIHELKVKAGKIKVENEYTALDTFINSNTSNGVFTRQVIRYELDSEGLVTNIETAASYNRDGLYKFSVTSGTYRSAQRSFSSNVVMTEKAVVFVVPTDSEASNDKLYDIKDMKYFSSGTSYSGLAIYGYVKDRLAAEIIVRKSNSEGYVGYTTPISVVQKITQGVNTEGETMDKLYVWKEGKEVSANGRGGYNLRETTRDPNDGTDPQAGKMPLVDVDKGDIVRYTTTGQNEVGFVQMFYDRSQDKYLPSANPMSLDNGNLKIGIGTVLRRDGNIIEFQYRNSTLIEYYYIDKLNIAVYDDTQSEGKEIRNGDINDIRDAENFPMNPSILFIHSNYGSPKTMVVYNK